MGCGVNIRTWFQGAWHDGDVPILRAADHGAWLGTMVFDGARWFEGVTPDLDAHCERVNHSARVMGMEPTHSAEDMVALVNEGLAPYADTAAVYIRPMYWSVEPGPGLIPPDPGQTAFCICLEEIPMPAMSAATTLTTTRFRRPTLDTATVNAKASCLYPNNARMVREAHAKGFGNALVTDLLGNVAETATSNIFMVRDGEVFTPVPNGTFLNGITRQRVIKLLRADGVTVHEVSLTPEDFRGADEVFTSGNYSKVAPVSAFDNVTYETGPVTKRARDVYWDWAHSS